MTNKKSTCIDTNIICDLQKSIVRHQVNGSLIIETVLDKYIKNGTILIILDTDGGIIGEWECTANCEFVKQLVTTWKDYGGISIKNPRTIPSNHRRKLQQIGIHDTIDKLIIRLLYHIDIEKYIISRDPDFWDPSINPSSRSLGNDDSKNAKYLRDKMDINVKLLDSFINCIN